MNHIANKFASWIVSNGGSQEDHEVYAYGIECFLNTLLTFGLILVVGALLDRLLVTVVWLVFFSFLRHASGGLHAPNHIGCLILSLSIGIGCMIANPFLAVLGWNWIIILAGLIGSIVIVFLFAPVIHKNHPVSKARIPRIRKTARVTIMIESCLILLLFFFAPPLISIAAILGVLSASISTLIGHFIN